MAIFKLWMAVLSTNLLVLLCFGLESNQIYHITPTSSYPCPVKPCLTLSQFAKSQSTKINTTLLFLPGIHSLGWKLSVVDINKFSMTTNHNDSSTEIICHRSGGLHFTDVHAVHIKSLDFTGCAGNQVENVKTFTLEDSNFVVEEDTRISGAALELYSTSIVISKGSFRFYRGRVHHVHSIGGKYEGLSVKTEVPNTGSRYRIGGAIFSINSSTTILDSTFEGNSASVGGAIFAECNSNVTVINSVFTNNYVRLDTGINLSITKCSGGGVLFAGNGAKVMIHGSQFHQNTADKFLSGGVLMAGLDTVINISASQFTNNSAMSSCGGGVLYVTDSHSTSNLNFALTEGEKIDTNHDNKTNLGGYFSDYDGVKITITNSWFVSNSASSYGGVIKVDTRASHLSVTDSKFFRNSALISGGVIDIHRAEESILKIASSDFTSNSAGSNGGVIYSDQSFVIISESCKFDHNTALNNGGVITNHNGSLKILGECEFNHNKAYNDGGVIHTYQGTISISEGNNFNSNVARNNGGVVYSYESFLTISRTNIFDNNTAKNGAAINTYEGKLTVSYKNIFSKNVAYKNGGAIFAHQSKMSIYEENVFSHNMALNVGGAVHVYQQKLDISETKFVYNKASNDGGAIWAHEANTMITRNYYDHNYAGNRGGVWNVYKGYLRVFQSSLSCNEATNGGAIYADMGNITVENTTLVGNRASKGGALHTYQSAVFIVGSNISKNSAGNYGGGWHMREGSALVTDSVFEQNLASDQGGTWYMDYSSIVLKEIVITGSSANTGAALYATGCKLSAFNSLLISENTAHTMGTIFLSHGSLHFHCEIEFSKNYGSLVMFNSNATFLGTTKVINCSEPIKSRDNFYFQDQEGGGLTLFKSHVIFSKRTTLRLLYNHARDGGAIHAAESKVYMYGDTIMANNSADNAGGGLHLFRSELNCQQNCLLMLLGNEAVEKGGGIIAINSTLNVEANISSLNIDGNTVIASSTGSMLYFIDNKAARGGGLYLDVYTKLYVKALTPYNKPDKIVSFIHNEAKEYGGAVYTSHCSGTTSICLTPIAIPIVDLDSKVKECPIQTLATNGIASNDFTCSSAPSKSIYFHENSAKISGSSIFEERMRAICNIRIFYERRCTSPMPVKRIDYFHTISNIKEEDIGSQPVSLCFCKQGKPNCNYKGPRFVRVLKGDKVSIEMVAMDQVGNPVNAIIISYLVYSKGHLHLEDHKINATCTVLLFDVSSQTDNQALKMQIKHSSARKSLNIQYTTCDSCPVGFIKTDDENSICKCDCDPQLKPYITVCNASQETVTREGDFWITHINTSEKATSGYLIYPFCPYNYCLPPTSAVEINFNLPDGADSQCANGHSGLLCGQCQSGLSLSLGSSHCIPCSTKWPIMPVVMLTVALLAGVLLVALLMLINLTVAIGTLNSIIFYANIVDANSSIFLPFSTPTIANVFIAGLNIEIGFDTCFFEGMDAYWKTLIQLAFPLYVIFLVVMMIFTTECSTRFAKLLARKNPVATLATLILLSYSKLLQTIIASLSFATLHYPDGSHRTVWLPDGIVDYLRGKHIVLFVIAIIILLAGAVYTTLLFAWQWLLRYQDKTLLRWIKYQKLCHFIEPYHAPYAFSQRYWFGLLLIARIPIYIVSAVTNNPRVKLLSTNAVIICLLLVKIFSSEKQIYRKRLLDVLDTIVHMNIISFSALTWYTFDLHSSQHASAPIAYSSICVTFILLVCVIIYHMVRYTGLFSAIRKTKMSIAKLIVLRRNAAASRMSRIPAENTPESTAIVTYSTVELSECTIEASAVSSDRNDPLEEAHSPLTC